MNALDGTKILRHTEAVDHYKRGEIVPPITAEIDLTEECNHKCPACIGGRKKTNSLSLGEAKNYLSQLAAYGAKAVVFTGGGEPLMSPFAVAAVQYAASLGLQVGVITNGSLLSPETAADLLPCCDWIRVSLDAATAATYKLTHGMDRAEYANVLRNIVSAARLRERNGNECRLVVGFLTGHSTAGDMARFTRQMSKIVGVSGIHFRPFSRDQIAVVRELLACDRYEREDFSVMYSQRYGTEQREYDFCHAANFMAVIQADGKMPVCCQRRGQEKLFIGDLRVNSLREIWESEHKRNVLESIDVSLCPVNCRYDSANRWLHVILRPKPHDCFL